MMKAYIATRLENHAKHNEVRDHLWAAGVGLTYDWSVHGPVYRDGCDRIRQVCLLEMNGVTDADFVIVILPGGRGTHVELGMALVAGKQVYILAESEETRRMNGATPETCAFYHHPLIIWTYGIEHLMNYVTTCQVKRKEGPGE